MKQRDEKGRFVRTTPDYKALYEAECSAHDREKEVFLEMRKERDAWKAKYEKAYSHDMPIYRAYDKLANDLANADERIAFLLDLCPFWVRWMFRRKFEKRKE